jgi:HPt (histidine-containing phosphotransfer) domain-containing protein
MTDPHSSSPLTHTAMSREASTMKPVTSSTAPADAGHTPTSSEETLRVLDVADGLDRIMGDRGLYFKMLWRFKHDHHGAVKQIEDAVNTDQYAAAKLKVHTLKGAAGMIGARELHGLATKLEASLRAQAQAADLPLAEFGAGLKRVLNSIHSILPGAAATPAEDGQQPPANPATLAMLTRLAHYLREGDGAAIDLLENSATMLAASLGVALYQEVAAAAHEFDFEGALATLTRRQWE